MTIKLGIVMDSIDKLNYKKDSSLAMLWEAADRDWEIHYFEQKDLWMRDGKVYGQSQLLSVYKNESKWFEYKKSQTVLLSDLNVILMRKDPPFDLEYIYTTYLLENAEAAGTLIVNKAQSLRDANEKLFTSWFPQCCPPTLVTRDMKKLREFFIEHQDIVCKPLDAMGGHSIFRLNKGDQNASVVFELLTENGARYTMAQRYIPEILKGDKRIIIINGEPIPFALARVPAAGELRGNLVAGGKGIAQALTDRDRWICAEVAPILREKGLMFVGLDVIGDYLTEINVTSPTGIRELNELCGLDVAATLMDFIEVCLSS